MKLTQEEVKRILSWKEGERFNGKGKALLPEVCFSIVGRHAHKAKTARGKLRRAAEAIRLVLDVLENPR